MGITNEEIVKLVQEKIAEKNEVIREQQLQIQDLQQQLAERDEALNALRAQLADAQKQLAEVREQAADREELYRKLAEVVD